MHIDYQSNRLDKTKYKEFDGERRKPALHDNTQQRPGSRLQISIEVTGLHHAEGKAAGDQSEWSGPQYNVLCGKQKEGISLTPTGLLQVGHASIQPKRQGQRR